MEEAKPSLTLLRDYDHVRSLELVQKELARLDEGARGDEAHPIREVQELLLGWHCLGNGDHGSDEHVLYDLKFMRCRGFCDTGLVPISKKDLFFQRQSMNIWMRSPLFEGEIGKFRHPKSCQSNSL